MFYDIFQDNFTYTWVTKQREMMLNCQEKNLSTITTGYDRTVYSKMDQNKRAEASILDWTVNCRYWYLSTTWKESFYTHLWNILLRREQPMYNSPRISRSGLYQLKLSLFTLSVTAPGISLTAILNDSNGCQILPNPYQGWNNFVCSLFFSQLSY